MGNQADHFQFARRERLGRGLGIALEVRHEAGGNRGRNRRPAADRASDGGEQRLPRGVLEQVACGAGFDCGQDLDVGVVGGEDQDRRRIGQGGGLGLIGMRERAEILGGRMAVESSPGEGTAIAVTLPALEATAQ